MQPTIGRIVHCMADDGTISPAIITFIDEVQLGLTVFKMNGPMPLWTSVDAMAPGPREAKAGQWWWPERL